MSETQKTPAPKRQRPTQGEIVEANKVIADLRAQIEKQEQENEAIRNQSLQPAPPPTQADAAPPRKVHTQQYPSDSRALAKLDRVNYFYVRVAHTPTADEPVHIDDYLDKVSPSDPSKPMYEVVAEGKTPEERRLTGSSKMALLRCSMADKKLEMQTDIQAASYKQAAKKKGDPQLRFQEGQVEEFEDLRGGTPLISL